MYRLRTSFLFSLVLIATLSTPFFAIAKTSAIASSNGWVRSSPPGSKNGVAFVTLHNNSDTPQQLEGVQCAADIASRCELHQHLKTATGMRMQKVDGLLDIPARGELRFAPGGYHIMLTGLVKPLTAGSSVELIFTFADQSTYHVQLPVKSVHEE